jgi:large subunit ribosomal protein L35
MSHKSGKQVRRLRKKVQLNVSAENRRIRNALLTRQATNPLAVEAAKAAAVAEKSGDAEAEAAVKASDAAL